MQPLLTRLAISASMFSASLLALPMFSVTASASPADVNVVRSTAMVTSSPGRYIAATGRAIDTRQSTPLGVWETRSITLPGVPTNATAVVVNVTAVDAATDGSLWVWGVSNRLTRPSRPNVTFPAFRRDSQNQANLAMVALGGTNRVNVLATAATHVIVDIQGYYAATNGTAAGRYVSLTPTRLLDTRHGARPSSDATVYATIPADIKATSVLVNVTAVDPLGAGFLTAYPVGQWRPNVSNVNYGWWRNVPNAAVVPVGIGNKIAVYTYASAHVIVDIMGYYTDGSASWSTEGLFVATPKSAVIADSVVSGTSPLLIGGGTSFGTAVLTTTVHSAQGDGFLTVSPWGKRVPVASNVNFKRGETVTGLAVTPLGTGDAASIYTWAPTGLTVTLAGFFTETRYEPSDDGSEFLVADGESGLGVEAAEALSGSADYKCGRITCSIYLDATLTKVVGDGGIQGFGLCAGLTAALAAFTGPVAAVFGLGCGVQIGAISFWAAYAHEKGKCLRIRITRPVVGLPMAVVGLYDRTCS